MAQNQKLKRKVRNSYLISTISIALVLFLLGSMAYIMIAALDVSNNIRDSITATVELKRGTTERVRERILTHISAHPLSGDVHFSSKEEKIKDEEFRKMFGLEFETILKDNPLMDSFEVTLALSSSTNSREQLEEFASNIGAITGVDRVSYPAVLAEQVHSTINSFQILLLLFGSALLFISLVLLNNTIRMAIFSRRGIINTMKLVGATKWFIVRPFLLSGMWSGFWAGIIASLLMGGALYGLQETLLGMLPREQLITALKVMGAMVGGGMVISTLFTWGSVSRFVNMKSNKIQLY